MNQTDPRENTFSVDRLQRQLGLGAATAVVAGEGIGVGIVLTPAGMARELGSPFWLLVVWVIVGITAITCALAVTLAYVLISMVFIYLVPFGQIASDETLMAQAGERLFGGTGGAIMTGIVALCVLGGMAALLILSPRVYYAMARDGLFFQSVTKFHPRYRRAGASGLAARGAWKLSPDCGVFRFCGYGLFGLDHGRTIPADVQIAARESTAISRLPVHPPRVPGPRWPFPPPAC